MNIMRDKRTIVLTVIVYLLLLIYAVILIEGIGALACLHRKVCDPKLNMRLDTFFPAIAGLVSAVVVAALAIKTDGNLPGLLSLSRVKNVTDPIDWATWIYVGVWLVLGAIALGLNFTLASTTVIPPELSWIDEYTKTYFGTLLGAGYAFLKIKPINPGS